MSLLTAWTMFLVMLLSAFVMGIEVIRAYSSEARRKAESTILHCVGQRLVVHETRTLGTATDCEMYVVKPAKLIFTESTHLWGKAEIIVVEPGDPRIASAVPFDPNPTPPPTLEPSGRL